MYWTDRQTDTDRDRQRQTETDRDRQRQTETDRDRQRDKQRQTETDISVFESQAAKLYNRRRKKRLEQAAAKSNIHYARYPHERKSSKIAYASCF